MPIENFTITGEQRDQIERLLQEALDSTSDPSDTQPQPGTFHALYDYIVLLTTPTAELQSQLSASDFQLAQSVHRFLRGARQVNSDIGFFSPWIRNYTDRQIRLRTTNTSGRDLSGWIQFASNQIIVNIAQNIITNFDQDRAGDIPTVTEIAEQDAAAAVSGVFLNPAANLGFRVGDSGAGDLGIVDGIIGAAWAGTPFFADVGSPQQMLRLLRLQAARSILATRPPQR